MILRVARLGHPVLRRKARPVPPERIGSAQLQALIEDMIQTMHDYDGVGIAATQVHVSLQVAVIESQGSPRYPRAPRIPLTVLINPKVQPIGRAQALDWEGCLSVEGLRGRVARWRAVQVQAYNRQGRPVQFAARGFFARVIQHEWDHLHGKVYLDRMRDLSTLTYRTEYARYEDR